MLRHYDQMGLLKPSQTDEWTGYRYYTIEQLARLHRIIALKGLGFSLEQVADLLNRGETVPALELRGMLKLRQAEITRELQEKQSQLASVETRLQQIEQEGIQICESTFGLEGILVEDGTLTRREPSKKEWEDIRYGWDVGKQIGALDIGQCVVVKDRVIVAVEAVEGTDGAIRRGGELAHGGAVVVKRCKPQQDLRFDLPAVGPRTIEVMESVKASVLALEAGRGILLDRDETIAKANRAGIAIVGMT